MTARSTAAGPRSPLDGFRIGSVTVPSRGDGLNCEHVAGMLTPLSAHEVDAGNPAMADIGLLTFLSVFGHQLPGPLGRATTGELLDWWRGSLESDRDAARPSCAASPRLACGTPAPAPQASARPICHALRATVDDVFDGALVYSTSLHVATLSHHATTTTSGGGGGGTTTRYEGWATRLRPGRPKRLEKLTRRGLFNKLRIAQSFFPTFGIFFYTFVVNAARSDFKDENKWGIGQYLAVASWLPSIIKLGYFLCAHRPTDDGDDIAGLEEGVMTRRNTDLVAAVGLASPGPDPAVLGGLLARRDSDATVVGDVPELAKLKDIKH
ncbi:hypothetical protein GGTG_06552 [Gaeumannomyces tritici R3-111a-1]|uniref:Uncharacterized protein n=1 Tax=Gaeumannomyces tritici (strain R3-111a-1) TaxID=644352 RepID=J3NZ52_GAET3|nr:hypothetical protein GGTG_06552 [Gaeumannomyces tritici R3-111a-1]EJT76635.1 hypothetical protein GGTG_06552 [Gaeumannomyces tritici R3-111a-1]